LEAGMSDFLSGHRKYRISLWDKFLKRAQKECATCDHYYKLIFTETARWVRGHFCLHWPVLMEDMPYDQNERLCKRKFYDSCPFYRNRSNEHPFNSLRKNKEYFDMTILSVGEFHQYRKPPKIWRSK
jgi:hypothetical protein